MIRNLGAALEPYFLERWQERLEQATRFMDYGDVLDRDKVRSRVWDDTRNLKVAEIRALAKHYGATKIPTDRIKAAHALADAFMTKPLNLKGGLGTERVRVGLAWDSPQGRRTVIAERDGRFAVEIEGRKGAEFHTADDVLFEMRKDAANLATRQKATERQAVEAAEGAEAAYAHGFYETMSPTQAGRARKALEKTQGFNRNIMRRKDAIEKLVAEGWRVQGTRLVSPTGSFYEQKDVTKTALDYARHLTQKGDLKDTPLGRAPKLWWKGAIPRGNASCFPTKQALLRVFVDENRDIIENYGGMDYEVSPAEFDSVNHKYGERAQSISDAIWAALRPQPRKKYCFEDIDLEALNDTSPAREYHVPFRLPDWIEEQRLSAQETQWYRDREGLDGMPKKKKLGKRAISALRMMKPGIGTVIDNLPGRYTTYNMLKARGLAHMSPGNPRLVERTEAGTEALKTGLGAARGSRKELRQEIEAKLTELRARYAAEKRAGGLTAKGAQDVAVALTNVEQLLARNKLKGAYNWINIVHEEMIKAYKLSDLDGARVSGTHRNTDSTAGWAKAAPKTTKARRALMRRCGRGAFLAIEKSATGKTEPAFPIVASRSTDCAPDCRGLWAAKQRASQTGRTALVKKATRIAKAAGCEWARGE